MKKYIVLSIMIIAVLTGGYVALKVPCPLLKKNEAVQGLAPLPKTAQFKHPQWTDTLIFDSETRVHRSNKSTETAKIVKRTNKNIVLSWDNWGVEEFELKPDGSYQFIE